MDNFKALSPSDLKARLPYPLHRLADLAYNFWWSWSPERLSIFRSIDSEIWEYSYHNPVKLLSTVSHERLAQMATDPYYLERVKNLVAEFDQYMSNDDTWVGHNASEIKCGQPFAYFSIEFGLHQSVPTYGGGLGILAADHLKSASDMGVPMVGVGLLYSQGYFHQRLDSSGWQTEDYYNYEFCDLPLELLHDEQGEALTIKIQLRQRSVKAQVWLARVGRVSLYLLDTNREDNEPVDQEITRRLYGGGQDTRIAQEFLLGIGGVRALHRLGFEPPLYHLNEGHAAFVTLEVARLEMEKTGHSWDEVCESVKNRCVFTTHTPVPAGHDTFSAEQISRHFCDYWPQLGLKRKEFLSLGLRRQESDWEPFNMTVLALRLTRAANGVSQLNGRVCREMWASLYPDRPVEEVPIGAITNGVHARTFTAPLMSDMFSRYLREDWAAYVMDTEMWKKVEQIPDEELWWRHLRLKERLVAYTRSRIQRARQHCQESQESLQAAEELLDPEALTIGFARRFTTYKRGNLILSDPDRAKAIFSNGDRPVQLIFSGKAHPHDEESKRIIQNIIQWSNDPDLWRRVVFIEDYDIHVAKKLVQGVDLWLNNPRRPLEASGTSGQKVCFNGGLNCSVLDGWWYEAYQAGPDGKGVNGWAIASQLSSYEQADDPGQENAEDSASLYNLLENEIIPLYFDRDEKNLPRGWLRLVKNSLKTLCPYFNTDRMVGDYLTQMYLPESTAKVTQVPIRV